MECLFWGFCWPIFLIGREREDGVNESLIFGLILPAGIFLISIVATWLIYRRFARRERSPSPEKEKDQNKA